VYTKSNQQDYYKYELKMTKQQLIIEKAEKENLKEQL
jgi:hypothetical protein